MYCIIFSYIIRNITHSRTARKQIGNSSEEQKQTESYTGFSWLSVTNLFNNVNSGNYRIVCIFRSCSLTYNAVSLSSLFFLLFFILTRQMYLSQSNRNNSIPIFNSILFSRFS
ncbi:hypothetical protein PUN28_010585 [Cardiocondyla obscurior]|uniref:Uncharacterized protein n=1 Tax=Cardiocondyla obscurior TaxID=286306 RepID=A0AAW2FLR0_9HYME